MLKKNTSSNTPHLSVTGLSQYVRLRNCDRYLYLQLNKDKERELIEKWNITIQPLTPLLKESGLRFEKQVEEKLSERGEPIVNLEKEGKEGVEMTKEYLRSVDAPTILLQAPLQGEIGPFSFSGIADVIRLERDRHGELRVYIADIKASRKEKMEHRLQVALYAELLQQLADEGGVKIAEIKGGILHIQEDGSVPSLDPDRPSFDLDTYILTLHHLIDDKDSVLSRIESQSFEDVFYHLGYWCDGCFYNSLCMYDTAEREDLSLIPQLTSVEKRAFHRAGVKSLRQVANLMELPSQNSGEKELVVPADQKDNIEKLNQYWPLGTNLPFIVQRARRAVKWIDPNFPALNFIYGSQYSTLPSEETNPGLVKIFFDVQYDYLRDTVYLFSALVKGPEGEHTVVECADSPPTWEDERRLLVNWLINIFKSASEVSRSSQFPVHLYCYNAYDQGVLLEALKRHLEEVSFIPGFFDLITQPSALKQPIISFLATELAERTNYGRVCLPLHDAARIRRFDWEDDDYAYYELFRARLFDNRRTVIRLEDGSLKTINSSQKNQYQHTWNIESASRFNSQIPLEYAYYGAWGELPDDHDSRKLLYPFQKVSLDALKAFARHRVNALAHIESKCTKSPNIQKEPINLKSLSPEIVDSGSKLAKALKEFLVVEHYTSLQSKLQIYAQPIEQRVQTGLALLLRHEMETEDGIHRFVIDFDSLAIDPKMTLNAFRLKEGSWVVLNLYEGTSSANQIKSGKLAVIHKSESDAIELKVLDLSFGSSRFRFFHKKLQLKKGKHYTIDEMADDMNADKTFDALDHADTNTLYQWLNSSPDSIDISGEVKDRSNWFAKLIDQLERHRLTARQRDVVASSLGDALFLVQGPPGTGKSHTLAWAVLNRIFLCAAQGRPCRVAVSSKTHKAVNIVLEAIASKWRRLTSFGIPGQAGMTMEALSIYKIVNDSADVTPNYVHPLSPFRMKDGLNPLLRRSPLIIGGTPGGLYNLRRYAAGRKSNLNWDEKTFDLLVIDEASQMSVPEGVLASAWLKEDGRMIVVGDHRQMPPIISHPWEDEQRRIVVETRPYLSLFEFLRERNFPNVSLDRSFRLHKKIAEFLQQNVYALDGIRFYSTRTELLEPPPPKNAFADAVMAPECPIVVIEHQEQSSQQFNELEYHLVKPLIEVCSEMRLDGLDGIGVVVPHRAQRALLKEQFPELATYDSIDTVERFQGGERDIIIVSATASDPDFVLAEADFLLNLNRLNVALSRPRKKLIVVASRSVTRLLTSDLNVFDNAAIWKKLFFEYADTLLWEGEINGVPVRVSGAKA